MSSEGSQTIDRFQVIRRIGRGAQGTVYLGKDPNLERYVAIKVLHASSPELGSSDDEGKPREGLISSRLRHPNIVSIHEAGTFNGLPYLVFEYVQGKTLRQILDQQGAFSIEGACALMGPIIEGVSAAHKKGIIHLDLNPRNVLVDREGIPRIMDFGLSQNMANLPSKSGRAAGTLRYMAPEHFSDDELGPYTDVFALGSTFYELVSGQALATGELVFEVIEQIVANTPDLSGIREQPLGKPFARFLEGALEKDFRARYFDGLAMKRAFESLCGELELDVGYYRSPGAHSTIDFLMRRMQRKEDFPTISHTLMTINRLTNEGNNTSTNQLAKVILRDYALTSKLLKLVNSAFYGGIAGEIKSISHAIMVLGYEKVRMTANSLTFFSHLKGEATGQKLKDSMIRSFLSGLIARHLAQQLKIRMVEEAFILGLFQNLGENLSIYYFPDEEREISELWSTRGMKKSAASRGVLGVSYGELGAAVARSWRLPDSIIDSIQGLAPDTLQPPKDDSERLRDIAVFANEFCTVASNVVPAMQDIELNLLLERFEPSVMLSASFCRELLAAGLEKLKQYAPIFEINVEKSPFFQSASDWLEWGREQEAHAESDEPAHESAHESPAA